MIMILQLFHNIDCRSIVVPEHVRGYIYIEAFKQTHVKEAIAGEFINVNTYSSALGYQRSGNQSNDFCVLVTRCLCYRMSRLSDKTCPLLTDVVEVI